MSGPTLKLAEAFRSYSPDVRGLAAYALAGGGNRVSMSRLEWNVAGYCEAPYEQVVWGRPDERQKRGDALEVLLLLPCRNCIQCRRAKARHWTDRAEREVLRSARTRLVTLTVNPEQQAAAWLRRVHQLALRGVDADLLSPRDTFAERAAVFSPEITKWLKRIRKRSGAKLRYMVVAEAHKRKQRGLPHFHVLLHETEGKVTLDQLGFRAGEDSSWQLGFGHSKVVWPNRQNDLRGAAYVCKYLAKDLNARVRASLGYGKPIKGAVSDQSLVKADRGVWGGEAPPNALTTCNSTQEKPTIPALDFLVCTEDDEVGGALS